MVAADEQIPAFPLFQLRWYDDLDAHWARLSPEVVPVQDGAGNCARCIRNRQGSALTSTRLETIFTYASVFRFVSYHYTGSLNELQRGPSISSRLPRLFAGFAFQV
jgi:hypothetical protein